MIEGIDNDDMYRMVEDEFLAVAKDFTRHLHAAEYQRLKGLAKSQNAETIQNISRPVEGEMTDFVKRRHAALDTASKQHKGIAALLERRAAGNGTKSEDERKPPRRPATSLQGLMDSPRKRNVPLTLMPGSRPGSRHREAIGASPSRKRPRCVDQQTMGLRGDIAGRRDETLAARHERELTTESDDDDDDDDDDLDGQPHWPPKRIARRPEPPAKPPARPPPTLQPPERAEFRPANLEDAFQRTDTPASKASIDVAPLSEPADLPPEHGDQDFFSRLRARRAEQKRRRETKAQDTTTKTTFNSIPFT
jgi:hypothetical protein